MPSKIRLFHYFEVSLIHKFEPNCTELSFSRLKLSFLLFFFTGKPHKLIFSIEAGNEATDLFHIDPDTGMMSTLGKLDYESKRHHQLRIRATDSLNGGQNDVIVLFEVEDVNDCKPIFEKSEYFVNISEAAPVGASLIKISSSDADGPGPNSEVQYSLIRSSLSSELSLFNVDPNSGEVTLRSFLDRERKEHHVLEVLAVDQGDRPLSNIVKVFVTVLDANDNAPTFEDLEYNVRLSDKASRGQFVASVRAIDPDEESNLSYGIIGGNEDHVFAINPKNGIVTLANLHSFGQVSSYSLNLSVTDGVFSAFSKLKIGLLSANSHTPYFAKKSFKVNFAEGQPEGVRVAGK